MLHFQQWKLILVSVVVILGLLYALPNLFPTSTMERMPSWLPHKQVNLGLDLQGGAHLLYQLDEKEMIDDWLNTIRGAKRFGRVTQDNVGLPFAIVLDNKVISAPVIREPILGGTGQISGNFSVQEANDLSVLLRSGALPAKLTVIEERTVGASLGADSIESGKVAAYWGLGLVVIFMFVAYGLFGLFANLALIINVALIFAVLSLMGATLTLPGIAGIVLVIGIAVDANVLINERIREEVRSGKSPFAAVEAGYTRALTTIIDSNVTTLIAVLVLFWMGSGPVRGFAITLTVGIIASMFTAVTVTRLMIAYWLRWARPQALPI